MTWTHQLISLFQLKGEPLMLSGQLHAFTYAKYLRLVQGNHTGDICFFSSGFVLVLFLFVHFLVTNNIFVSGRKNSKVFLVEKLRDLVG